MIYAGFHTPLAQRRLLIFHLLRGSRAEEQDAFGTAIARLVAPDFARAPRPHGGGVWPAGAQEPHQEPEHRRLPGRLAGHRPRGRLGEGHAPRERAAAQRERAARLSKAT